MDRLRPSEVVDKYSDLINFVDDRPGHDERYAIDSSKVRNDLGWYPATTLEKGLEKTVQWYLNNPEWWQPLLKRSKVGQRLGKHI